MEDEEYTPDPPPEDLGVSNTGDCIDQVGPVTNRTGLDYLLQCMIAEYGITDPDVKELIERHKLTDLEVKAIIESLGITDPEEDENPE